MPKIDNKYDFWKYISSQEAVKKLFKSAQAQYYSKYYNLWMNKFRWNGLDEDNKEQEQNYIMRKLWCEGKVALRNIANTTMMAIMPFAVETYNYLDFPDTVTLINERGASEQIIPASVQIVNKDVALLYALPGQKPIEWIVRYYTERIAQAAVLINNNLAIQNMPFIIGCNEEDKKRLQDVVSKVLNNELVVFTDTQDVQKLQVMVTQAPYIVDKLQTYIVSQENELLTILGIDNTGSAAKKAQMVVDEVNANNDVINDYGASIEDELRRWLDRANKVLGRNITIEATSKPVDSTHDYEDVSIVESKEGDKE